MTKTFEMTREMKAATSILGWGFERKTWSALQICNQAKSNCIALIGLYNAHSKMGEMLYAAGAAIGELDCYKNYTAEEAKALLNQADVAVRELLDD